MADELDHLKVPSFRSKLKSEGAKNLDRYTTPESKDSSLRGSRLSQHQFSTNDRLKLNDGDKNQSNLDDNEEAHDVNFTVTIVASFPVGS